MKIKLFRIRVAVSDGTEYYVAYEAPEGGIELPVMEDVEETRAWLTKEGIPLSVHSRYDGKVGEEGPKPLYELV